MTEPDPTTESIGQIRADIRDLIGADRESKPLRQEEIRRVISTLSGIEVRRLKIDRLSEILADVIGIDARPRHPYRKETLLAIRDALRDADAEE